MTKFEKFTFKNEKGKYISGIVVDVTEDYYIIDFLGGNHQTVPINFFDDMERIYHEPSTKKSKLPIL